MTEKSIGDLGRNFAAALLGIFICVLIFFIAEIYCTFKNKNDKRPPQTYSASPVYMDRYGISRPWPSKQYRVVERDTAGKLIYDVTYSADAYSRRITPVVNPNNRAKHLLFFGCSYTYGEGLQERETLPAQVGGKTNFFMPYNYAFHGHSPSEMYGKLKSGTLLNEVNQKEGVLVYVFMDEHVDRVVGSMRLTTLWAKDHPYYVLGKKNEVILKGNFSTGRPVLRKIYRLLAKSNLLKSLNVDFPLFMMRKHFFLTARLIEESEKLYREEFPLGRFYMVIYPGSRRGGKMKEVLTGSGIKIIDYSNLFEANNPEYHINQNDLHPSVFAIRVLADQLVQDLDL